ncbi:MAG: cyclic nucleotide-binding domain-containing protein [Thiogranum sp.]
MSLPAGRDVFRLGDAGRNYLVVIEGTVGVQAPSSAGREVVLYRVGDGQSCVLTTACLISGERYPAEGIAETVAPSIPHPMFKQAVAHSVAFQHLPCVSHPCWYGADCAVRICRSEDFSLAHSRTGL